MPGFLLRWGAAALGLWVATRLVSGVVIDDTLTLMLAALLLGFVNATVRPLVILLTLPATVLSLGLFLLVINAGMLAIVAALLEGFRLADLPSAFLGALVVSLVSWLVSWNVGPSGRVEMMVIRRDDPGR